MVSLVYHRPHCFALDTVVTITADRCAGPRAGDPRFPKHCARVVRCFYMQRKVRGSEPLTNPLARPRDDGTFEPVRPDAEQPGEEP